jgi:methyl-accepting chemotaxis protein
LGLIPLEKAHPHADKQTVVEFIGRGGIAIMGKQVRLGTKLIGGFVAVSVMTCLVGLVGYRGMHAGSVGQNEIATAVLPAVNGLWMASKAIADIRRSELIIVTPGGAADELSKQKQSMKGYYESLDRGMKGYEPIPRDKAEDADWNAFKAALAAWNREHDQVVALMERGDREAAFKVAYGSSRAPFKQTTELLGRLVELNMTQGAEVDQAFDREFKADMAWMLALVAAGFALSLATGIYLSVTVTKSLNKAIEGLSEGAEQVSHAASQLSVSSQGLAEGSSEQAASLEESASAMEEMSAMTRRNSESAAEARALTDRAALSVGQANGSMTQLVGRMAEISSTSEEIGKIIKTIDEIAFQTNLLALNAAVEAARAGEAGAGFAVVADEVRNLAQRAAGAAKNTSDLIERTIGQIRGGTQLVEKTESDFREVTSAVGKVTELVAEVAAASSEQTRGIAEVSSAVAQMDRVTQQNAANAEEIASASEEMAAQTASVREIVDEMKALVRGSAQEAPAGRATRKSPAGERAGRAAAPGKLSAPRGAVRLVAAKPRKKAAVDPESVFPLEDEAGIGSF